MNPFDAHAQLMGQYQTILAEPANGGQQGDVIVYAGAKITAVISDFKIDDLVRLAGGVSPRMTGQAIVQKSAVPRTVQFKVGQNLTVTQVGGSVRNCQIESLDDVFTEFRLNLWDMAQNA
ncbi:MAG: hypothetical protein KGJ13_06455 [Patescibacteria group bacterium]|nr:hypothetical protein [Patescibacteria group bacterium]